MHAPSTNPLPPIRWVPFQHIARQNPIPSSILHVDVDIRALHGDHDVHVDLQVVADAFFHREGVCLVSAPPAPELDGDEEEGNAEHGDGPFPAAGGLRYILGFCFGCERVSPVHATQSNPIVNLGKEGCIFCLGKGFAKGVERRTYEKHRTPGRCCLSSPQRHPRPGHEMRSRSSPALLSCNDLSFRAHINMSGR